MNYLEKNSTLLMDKNAQCEELSNKFKKMIVNNRPTFYFNGQQNMQLRAGGILFYKKINNQAYFLMIDNTYSKCLEDLGGKTDIKDNSIIKTIIREVEEETNQQIKSKNIYSILFKDSHKFYCEYSKYLLYVIKADEYISNLTSECFGDIEIHTGFDRKINWYSKEEFYKSKLNPRLNTPELKKFISSL